MTLIVRLLADGLDNDLIMRNGAISDLLKHKVARDGCKNFLGRGVPKVNDSWLVQNNIRKIVALYTTGDENSQPISTELAGVTTVLMPKKNSAKATLEMIKVKRGIPERVGTALMNFAEKMCWDENVDEIRLNVDRDNDRAIRFYRNRGYNDDSERQAKHKYKKELCLSIKNNNELHLSLITNTDESITKKRKRA
jgi:hypothetical protein